MSKKTAIFLGSLFSIFFISTIVFSWIGPSQNPPGGNLVVGGFVPVGTILAHYIDISNADQLSAIKGAGFALCDGTTAVSQGISNPIITAALPNLNNSGRFLRGANPGNSGVLQAMDWKTFSVAGFSNGTYVHSDVWIPKSGYNTTYPFGGLWQAPGNQLRFQWDTTSEIRPINMTVVWIIRVK